MRSYGTTNAAPYAAAPPVGLAGDTYFNTTAKKMYLSDGTVWIEGGGGSAPGVVNDGFTRYGTGTWASTISTMVDLRVNNVLVAQGSTYAANAGDNGFTIPNTGVYDITGVLSSNAAVFPTGSFIAIRVNGITMIRTFANRQHAYETIFVSIQRYLLAGDVVALSFYQEGGTFNRASVAQNALDPYSPMLSVWRAGSGIKGDTGLPGIPGSAANVGGYLWSTITPVAITVSVVNYHDINVPALSSGFTRGVAGPGNKQSAICSEAGRYFVVFELTAGGAAGGAYIVPEIRQYRGSTNIVNASTVVSTSVHWSYGTVEGIFELQVGDAICIVTSTDTSTKSIDYRSYLVISPVGGAKGDKGDAGISGSAVAVPPPYYSARASVAPTSANNTPSIVNIDTLIGTNAPGDFTLAAGSITVNSNGYYNIVGQVRTVGVPTTPHVIICYWSGSAWISAAGVSPPANGSTQTEVVWNAWLTAGTQVALFVSTGTATVYSWHVFATATALTAVNPTLSITRSGGAKGDKGDSGGPVPTGGAIGQTIEKIGTDDFDVGWAQTGKCIARRNGAAGGVILNANGGAGTVTHYVTATMVTGRLYRIEFTFRAIQGDRGMFSKLEKDSVLYQAFDFYTLGASGAVSWNGALISWILPGTGNEGSHSWRLVSWCESASLTCQIYNNDGGYAAVYDIGLDPGNQA